jgi:predicted amidohydrolase
MNTRARIATICQSNSLFPSVEANSEYVLGLLDLALRQKPDLVCLPETFTKPSAGVESVAEFAEPIPGPTTDTISSKARQHSCYVICPLVTRRDGKCWNSAVIVDRSGDILGIYDKVHPVTSSSDYTVFEEGVTPAGEIPVFDLDFGRVGVQICFDIGFPENWLSLSQQGARMVFWPSAYNGGFPLQVYAYLHHYYVVSSVRTDKSRIIDPCGTILGETDPQVNVIFRDINLDYVVCHYDFNYSIPDRIMEGYPGRVEIRPQWDAGHFLVEPLDGDLTTRQLQAEFGLESTFQYHQRHRDAHQMILQGRLPISQEAAHGDRPTYDKW